MKVRSLLVPALLACALTAGLLFMLRSSSGDGVAIALPEAAGPAGSDGSYGSAEIAAVSRDDTFAPSDERLSAPDGLRTLLVRLVAPEGTPFDPELSIVAVEASELEESQPHEILAQLRADDAGRIPSARATITVGGTARLAIGADLEDPRLILDGRFLYLTEPRAFSPDAPSITLEPELGACLVVSFSGDGRPAGTLSLTGGDFSGRRGGWQRRELEVDAGVDLTFRAIAADLTWTVSPELTDHHADSRLGLELEPGQELAIDVPMLTGATVRGIVVDATDAPIAGAEVKTEGGAAWFGGGGTRETTTDDDGRFELRAVAPGDQQIEATLDGWVKAESEDMELADGEVREGLRLVLSRGASISGIVQWPDGRPAQDAQVVVEALRRQNWGGWGGSRLQRFGEDETDDQGRFAVSGLEEGESFTVRATLDDSSDALAYDDEEVPTWRADAESVRANTQGLVLQLAGPLSFAGRVVDDRGEPVTEFEVLVASPDEGGPRETQRFEDDEGRFVFARVGPGEWELTASAEGHVQPEPLALELPLAETELEVALLRTATLSGRVVDASGLPVPEAEVQVDPGGRGGNPWGGTRGPRAEVDAEGRYTLADLEPGLIEVRATSAEWADSELTAFELAPGETVDGAILGLRVGGRIEGSVMTPEGDPVAGRRVTYGTNAMGFGSRDEARSDGGGRFFFDHVTPGEWAVSAAPSLAEMGERMRGRRDQSAWAEVMGELITETVVVADAEVVEVFLGGEPKRPVRITGLVTRAGEPISGAQVTAVSEESAVFQGMKSGMSAEDGSYELVVDRPGPHVVSATSGREGVEAMVDVPRADEARVDLSIPLGRIVGVVKRPDGRRAAGIRLGLQREDGLGRVRWSGGQDTTDEDGEFVFVALEEGRYTVRANVAGFGGGADRDMGSVTLTGIVVEADATTSGVDFVLESAGTITGEVTGPDGGPLAGASIFFRDATGALVTRVSGTVTDSAGRFSRAGLSPGEYTLSARMSGYASSEGARVTVASGESNECRLALEGATWLLVTLEEEGGDARRARIEVMNSDGVEVGNMMTGEEMRALFNRGSSSLERRVGPLPPGRYTVRATTADGKLSERRVRLRGGEDEKVLRLRLEDA